MSARVTAQARSFRGTSSRGLSPTWPFYIIGWHPYKYRMASRARSPGRLAAPAAGGRLPGLGLVTHRRQFNTASQRNHTGEPPTRHIFSSRRAAVRAHPISKDGVHRRPPRPPHAPSGGVPLGQTGGVRAQAPVQHREPNSPHMRVLPSAPKPEQTPGVRHVWRKHMHDGRRRPLSRCRRSSLGCQSVAACGEGSGSVRFVLASGGRAKGSGGRSEQTARMRSTYVTSTPRVT